MTDPDPIGRPWLCPRCYHVNGDDQGKCAFCRSERTTRLWAFVVVVLLIVGGAAVHHRIHEIVTAHQAG